MDIMKHLDKETMKSIEGLEKVCTQKGEIKSSYTRVVKYILSAAENKNCELYGLKYWTKHHGRYCLVDADYNRAIEVLQALNIDYKLENTAARGGAEGDTIIVNYDGRKASVKAIRSLIADIRKGIK